MKAIMVMFDSLNRHMLEPYGCDWVPTPNFQRLAQRTVTFDRSYVCSLPCMPARRDLHTGRPGFLHRTWGPLEPFDDSMPAILDENGIHSHLITDHYHYFRSGGANYHARYSSWEFHRGQEGDPWKPNLRPDFQIPETEHTRLGNDPRIRRDFVNRSRMPTEAEHYQTKNFDAGIEFLDIHQDIDNWFLQIESFDPHEPYFSPQKYKDLFPHDYDGPVCDWPRYGHVDFTDSRQLVDHLRHEYAALLAMCDHSLGRILDKMDEHDLWKDTMLIVNTDHGFLLGEHDYLAKNVMPLWRELSNTPLFLWDPRLGKEGTRCDALVQAIDWAPTVLDAFGIPPTEDMLGMPLQRAIENPETFREAAIFGYHGHFVNVTDGRYVYMRSGNRENTPLHTYTLAPWFGGDSPIDLFREGEPVGPLPFTKGVSVMRYPGSNPNWGLSREFGHLLYDLEADPWQQEPLQDAQVEKRMLGLMEREMERAHAPAEEYIRLGLR